MIETDIVVGAELRITCAKDELARALGVVARALSTRSSVQILSGILLEARDGDLQLAATDMELSLRASLSAQVDGDGAIVVPGKTLVDIACSSRVSKFRSLGERRDAVRGDCATRLVHDHWSSGDLRCVRKR